MVTVIIGRSRQLALVWERDLLYAPVLIGLVIGLPSLAIASSSAIGAVAEECSRDLYCLLVRFGIDQNGDLPASYVSVEDSYKHPDDHRGAIGGSLDYFKHSRGSVTAPILILQMPISAGVSL